MQNLKLD